MIRDVHPRFRIRILIFYPFRIPDPAVKKAPDPGSGSATLDSCNATMHKKKKNVFGENLKELR
jgi:hypothetical protein